MAELGIGVRVYVGWAPEHRVTGKAGHACCQKATIIGGAFEAGSPSLDPNTGEVHTYDCRRWRIQPDAGKAVNAAEFLLTPIDDDNDQATRDERELVEERT